MYIVERVVAITFTVSLISAVRKVSNCTDCITINDTVTLRFVLNETSLSNRELVLQGDHLINHMLTISDVNNLTIRSSDNTNSTIHCRIPLSVSDTGSGLVFDSVSNLGILNVIFEGCGTLQLSTTIRNGVNVKYRSAVYIINSTNINFIHSGFIRNVGRGLSLHDVGGLVEINNCMFTENKVPAGEAMFLFGGGGLYVEFTHCTPGQTTCNQVENNHNKRNTYVIKHCVFKDNKAANREIIEQGHIIQYRNLTGSDGNNAGQGGGIHITMKGTGLLNTITIHNCSFYNNSAVYGGGVDATLQDNSQENTINISTCSFLKNTALEREGGALILGYYASGERVANNTINVQDTTFMNNSAGRGGAVSFFSSRFKTIITTNRMEFFNCTWIGNSASIGAAMSVSAIAESSLFNGITPTPFVCKCSFFDNEVINTAAFHISTMDNYTTTKHELHVESGVFHLEAMEVKFNHYISFGGNRGSAIVATSSQINVLENTLVEFVNNTAIYGGAIALLGYSILELYPDSQIVFDSNHASELGGAIYATSSHQLEFIFSHKCFISHVSGSHPNNWTTSLIFTDNTAIYGHAIFTDSLLPCAKNVFDIMTDVESTLKWTPFEYTPDADIIYTIATSPATINFTLPDEIAPGERVEIHLTSKDDLKQSIPTSYQVFLDISKGKATHSYLRTTTYMSVENQAVYSTSHFEHKTLDMYHHSKQVNWESAHLDSHFRLMYAFALQVLLMNTLLE